MAHTNAPTGRSIPLAGRGIRLAFVLPALILLGLFFVLPLISVAREAAAENGAAFGRVLRDPVFWQGVKGSLVLGTLAPAFSVVVGFLVALHLSRLSEGVKALALFAISLPLTFSGLVIAYGFILVFGRSGFVTLLLAKLGADPAVVGGFIFSPVGLGLAYSYYLIPRVVLVMLPVLSNFDRSQIAAARSLGAGNITAHLDVLVPQVMPALITAFCLTSAVAIGAYGTALALVGTQVNILPLVLYSKISDAGSDFPAAAAISLLLMGLCCLVVGVAELFRPRRVV
ncbi:ABC transporter permease [Azorhizobium oxalatiphilum]|uniref:ABC transporter permease n=1 Tax=Azorhizobium oxalatiphilum TaxID=980631 RepID=A0A917C6U6_9HYPH|nr:ABC transporter permease subunit [Azorhizobium oxalatiphilum]GGF70770.1 ABC transporter permease [Azorhizobium oxalatiphilum]